MRTCSTPYILDRLYVVACVFDRARMYSYFACTHARFLYAYIHELSCKRDTTVRPFVLRLWVGEGSRGRDADGFHMERLLFGDLAGLRVYEGEREDTMLAAVALHIYSFVFSICHRRVSCVRQTWKEREKGRTHGHTLESIWLYAVEYIYAGWGNC